ncbi:unnamed protein product [Gongylonema pulchrum]|uniref:DUF5641 domain-containing protein n=1 Tax=Gongylonema pulchrum TaxID=637853 RepID=A0A183ENN4_9BILA|nr:unnamed protein product [Gongylonema pulchrum]
MPAFPECHVVPGYAFCMTAVDYFGPINVFSGTVMIKRWVALFICTTTRAIQKLLLQWSRTQQYLAIFWKFWQRDYLNMLRERTQRFLKGPHSQTLRPPRIGEVVLLKEEKMPRGSWKLVKITQLNQGLDNQIRTVDYRHKQVKKYVGLFLYCIHRKLRKP